MLDLYSGAWEKKMDGLNCSDYWSEGAEESVGKSTAIKLDIFQDLF